MRIKGFIFGLFVIILSSCSTPKYLVSAENIDVNVYGSQIKISHKTLALIRGELIAIDSNSIVVLQEKANMCTSFKISDIKKFKLRYAKSKNYGWTVPIYTLATIGHGVFFLFTAPLNLITTISITVGANNAFVLSNKNLTYEDLRMFARFPQGIPSGVALSSIR